MGDPSTRGWGPPCPPAEQLTTIEVAGIRLRVHKRIAVIFTRFVAEVAGKGYPVNDVADDWGYNCRHIGSDPTRPWSNHAWGLAIDLNATKNPMKRPLTTDMPGWIAAVAKVYGLRWGGSYTSTPDPMHFEFMGTPDDADHFTALLQQKEDWLTMATEEQLRKIVSEEITRVLRVAVGPDDASVPAGAYFGRIEQRLAGLQAKVDDLAGFPGGITAPTAADVIDELHTRTAPR